ncbi:MAG: hypothetical protein R6X29_05595 [Acidimicrobiia bacterium]|jgi:hypothetical protein
MRPAFYAPTGTVAGDLVAILHPPYTLWHLSYVAIGASLAPTLSLGLLAWTLVVFFLGLGVVAHALDEVHDRPLGTRFSDRALWAMAALAVAAGAVIVALGAVQVSGWVLGWAAAALVLAVGYPLEVPRWLHTDLGFAAAWGAFPVLAGYWVQTQRLDGPALLAASFALVLSLVQRALSTPARFVRRRVADARAELGSETWDRDRLLETWERPLRWLALAVALLAVGLVGTHL